MTDETTKQDATPPVGAPVGGPGPRRPDAPAPEHKEKISGVFSTQLVQRVGTGTTTRKAVKKSFWFVKQMDDGSVEIQPLNMNYVPSGPKRRVPTEDFLEKFSPEPEFYISTVYPKMKELSDTVTKGEKHREKGETFSAELEFNTALSIDEENIRANFGLGLTYLDRGDDTRANDIFERLVKLDAAFEPEHKHLFNEFGINLRKNKMYEQSVEYYERAMELSEQDEHLHYNVARAYYEKELFAQAFKSLARALELNPGFAEAAQFRKFLLDKNLVDAQGNQVSGATMPQPAPRKKAKKSPTTNYDMNI
ncbi:tetratricopeptide repeat protein [Desulfocurvus sp.]|jgi:tetratricopeptide (TPR) repeat protein|uniref:tetratricopeptide repeat protein n=1 Tax=Desulfocurvus sp. TaxID=2871698 RepID=UPI0025C67DCB|nr:tetratricopeptide repeat protein [Desulfocurvus sp.]MCK9239705.1 tetratricopeptide repeat protein [Desulfocurvus sp.]